MIRYYKYTLSNAVQGTLELSYAPVEWQSDQAFWERSMVYWGIFRSFSTKELTIIKNGAYYLKQIFEREGTEAICSYEVQELNTQNYTYSVIYTGLIDFSTYKYIEGSSGTFVKVQIIDDDFVNKFKTRESLPISLTKLIDVDGGIIAPFSAEGITVKVPIRTDTYNATLDGNGSTQDAYPFRFLEREDDSVIEVVSPTDATVKDAAFFNPVFTSYLAGGYGPITTELTINLKLVGHVTFANSGIGAVLSFKQYDKDGVLKSTTSVASQYTTTTNQTLNFSIDTTKIISSIASEDYIVLSMHYDETPYSGGWTAYGTTLSYSKIIFPDSNIKGYFYHEAFTRILQAVTGQSSPFYSEILGRTDSEIHSYDTDGDMSLGIVSNGLLIRGFAMDGDKAALNVSLRDLFLSLHTIYPLSLGVETIEGVQKARIESIEHVFNSDIFLSVEGATNINEEVANDITFSALSMGFSKAEPAYNKIKGRYEYNTAVKYSTPLTRQQNEMSNVAPYRADTNAIVGCLVKPASDYSSEDTNYDDSNFLINVVRDTTIQIARKENYTSVTGVDNPDHSYNLDYQPARNIRRWGAFIRSFVDKYSTQIISFIKSTNNSQASSQRIDESVPMTEGQDITISDFNTPWFENIYYTFDLVVTNAVMQAIASSSSGTPNLYKLVRFRNNQNQAYRYGWIMRFESQKPDNKGTGTMKLLKAVFSETTAKQLMSEEGNYIISEENNNITV